MYESGRSIQGDLFIKLTINEYLLVGGADYVEFEKIIMTISLTFGEQPARKRRSVPPLGGDYCFDVTIISDVYVEFDETFELLLTTSDEDITLFPNSTTINIINDDCKQLSPLLIS